MRKGLSILAGVFVVVFIAWLGGVDFSYRHDTLAFVAAESVVGGALGALLYVINKGG